MHRTFTFSKCVLIAAIFAAACGAPSKQEMIKTARDGLAQQGQIIREWEVAGEPHLLLRDGSRFFHMRISYVQVGIEREASSEVLCAVDTTTRVCQQGESRTPVECERLKTDEAIGSYITWQ